MLVTGDLASDHADLERVLAELRRIRCPNLLFVPGNYEREDAGAGRNPTAQGFFYVNRGLGTARLPFRLGVPPEIFVLEL